MMKGRDLVFHFSFQISSCIKENMFLSHRCRGEEWVTSWCPLFDKSSPLAAYSVLWGTSFNLSFIEWICVLEPAELHLKAWFQLEILRGEQSKEQHTAHWVSGELRPGLSHQCNCLYHHPWHLRFPNTFTFTHSFDLYKNFSVILGARIFAPILLVRKGRLTEVKWMARHEGTIRSLLT